MQSPTRRPHRPAVPSPEASTAEVDKFITAFLLSLEYEHDEAKAKAALFEANGAKLYKMSRNDFFETFGLAGDLIHDSIQCGWWGYHVSWTYREFLSLPIFDY